MARTTLQDIHISPTNEIKKRVAKLSLAGKKIIRFDTIETNLKTPRRIKEAAIQAIRHDFTKYTEYSGITKLKLAISVFLEKKYGLHYGVENVLVTCGSKHALFNTIFSLINSGDEVIIFAPEWTTYEAQVKIAGGVPVVIYTKEKDNFEPLKSRILPKLSSKTKAIVINSPCNPTGVVYSRNTLEMISGVAQMHKLWVISDETMANFVYGKNKHIPIASINPSIFSRSFTIGSVSKDYSMSGFRIGFVCGPSVIIRCMSNLQAQCTANPVSFSQIAALEAWSGPQDELQKTIIGFEKRRDTLIQGLRNIKGITNITGQGAVFLFPNVQYFLRKQIDGIKISKIEDLVDLLLRHGIAVVPGNYFGEEYASYLRISFSDVTEKEIKTAVNIISNLFQRVQ